MARLFRLEASLVVAAALIACAHAAPPAPVAEAPLDPPPDAITPTPPSATACDAIRDPHVDGAYSVDGLDGTKRRPIAILESTDRRAGSDDGFQRVTLYEDGHVVLLEWRDGAWVPTEGRSGFDAKSVSCRIASRLGSAPVRTMLTRATDQPHVSVAYRVGDAWRTVTVVGRLNANGTYSANPPPDGFLDAVGDLLSLPIEGRQPFTAEQYFVTFVDDESPGPVAVAPWPTDVPAPPALVPDERFVGRPRSYFVPASAGKLLRAFAREQRGPVLTPAGARVFVRVENAVPDRAYVDHVLACARWESLPFEACTR